MTGPERIWVAPCHPCTEPDDYYVCHPNYVGLSSIGYIRRDIHDEAVKALREIADCGQSAEPDHWKFRVMARERARAVLAKIGEAG